MKQSPAAFYTAQYYSWEHRGRGWFLADSPIYLEPPFIPFYRHGYKNVPIDDGRRHTVVSGFLSAFESKRSPSQQNDVLDYETIEPFLFKEERILKALQIKCAKGKTIKLESMRTLLIMLSYIDTPLSFEIIGTAKEIVVQIVCDESASLTVEAYIKAYFPDIIIIRSDAYIEGIISPDGKGRIVDFGLKDEFIRPIAMAKSSALDPLSGIIGILEQLQVGEQGGIQILFQGAGNAWNDSILRAVTLRDGTSFFANDPSAPAEAKEKIKSPLFGVTVRAFGQGGTEEDCARILSALAYSVMHTSKSPTNQLIHLSDDAYEFHIRFTDIVRRESHRLGMLLNCDELITILHFPSEAIVSKKLYAVSRKTKVLPEIATGKEFIFGVNEHNGVTTPVTASLEGRLKHTHILGATGAGKSTLIASLIKQDIDKGYGAVLCDPHGDLIHDVISSIPQERIKDVVLIDPSDTEYFVGLNILQAYSEVEKEVLSSDLVASFRKHATSWGDQMNAVLGNAILAVLESSTGGTLHDIRRFLIEKDFRQKFLKDVTDPSVLYYWHKEYPLLKSNSIGPILTRLDAFLRPKSIRNMLIQKNGLDFEQLINTNKIILCKLSQGLIGTENSYLLGSLILAKIHQAILRRQQTIERKPLFIYLDEFQHFITPSIKEMLSGVRKYSAGLILAHQDLQQLQREDGELLNSVLSNTNIRIAFRTGEADAKKLEDGFSGFDAIDLQNLGRGQAILRIEQPQYDCSMNTIAPIVIPQEDRAAQIEAVTQYSRTRYATPKAEIDKLLLEILNIDIPKEKPHVPKQEKTKEPIQKEEPKSSTIVTEPSNVSAPVTETEEPNVSTHRYLQMLVKRMAEAKGYTAILETQLPDGSGQVDVLLTKNKKTIAVEISVSTDAEWECHNIEKNLTAGYEKVVSLSGDPRQLERIKKKCQERIPNFDTSPVSFYTPDEFFVSLDEQSINPEAPHEKVIKGYRVNITYDHVSKEEIEQKRKSVAKVVFEALRKRKKNK